MKSKIFMSTRPHSGSRGKGIVPTYEFKGVSIKVYLSKGRFSAQYPSLGGRPHRFERATEAEALDAAKAEIRRESDLDLQVALREEQAAAEILQDTDISVIEAARIVRSSIRKLAPLGASLNDALDYYLRGHEGTPISVSALVDSLLLDKEATTGDKHVRDLRYRLNRFCIEFGERSVQSVNSGELSRWINNLISSPRNKRNYHSAIVALFEHGKQNGYLPVAKPTEIQLVKRKKAGVVRIDIFRPDDWMSMIRSGLVIRSPALIPMLIQGLAGVRHEELEQTDPKKDRLRWDDLLLDQPLPEIHIRPEVSKTGRERYSPIVPSLAAWLRRMRQSGHDPIYPRLSLFKDYRRICRHAGIYWRKNGLRKSFVTYDSALSGSINVTAKSSGNSAEMVRRYYRKETRQVGLLALDWFSVAPRKFGKEVKAYIAHVKAFPSKPGVRRKRTTTGGTRLGPIHP